MTTLSIRFTMFDSQLPFSIKINCITGELTRIGRCTFTLEYFKSRLKLFFIKLVGNQYPPALTIRYFCKAFSKYPVLYHKYGSTQKHMIKWIETSLNTSHQHT